MHWAGLTYAGSKNGRRKTACEPFGPAIGVGELATCTVMRVCSSGKCFVRSSYSYPNYAGAFWAYAVMVILEKKDRITIVYNWEKRHRMS